MSEQKKTVDQNSELEQPIYARTIDKGFPIVRVIKKPDVDMTVRFFDREDLDYRSDEIVAIIAPEFGMTCIRRKHIVKEADSIEELCDKCVVKLSYDKQPLVGSFYECEHFISRYANDNTITDIFGAIWITGEYGEPILKPAAKLHKEGEWELL
jgi:hypothetical protein